MKTHCPKTAIPLVSVVITNYNYGRYVSVAIQSVLNQSYGNIETIVVDDGSSDESHRVIAGFEDRITPLYIDHHGQCAAINAGFALCRGEIIVFLDADDYLIGDAIQRFVEAFTGNEGITKIQGYMLGVDAKGLDLNRQIPRRLSPSGDYKRAVLEIGPWVCDHAWTSGIAWARWFIEQVFPLPEDVDNRVFPDGCLNPLSVLYGPILTLKEPVAYYRIHGSNHGPIGTEFTAPSLRLKLTRMRNSFAFAAERAARSGIKVPLEDWMKWKLSWRDNLSQYAVSLMDKSQIPPGFGQMVFAPFKTRKRTVLRAAGLSLTLACIRVMPQKFRLDIIRHLLNIPQHRDAGRLKGVKVDG